MLDFILSTIVFFVAAFYLNRYLDEQDMNKGVSRSVLIFLVASIASFASSAVTGWISDEISGKQQGRGTGQTRNAVESGGAFSPR